MARHGAADTRGQPDRLRLGDQIADRQDQAVFADQDTAAGTLGAQGSGGKGVLRDGGVEPQDGPESPVQIKRVILRLGLQLGRYFPFNRSCHRGGSPVLICYDNAANVRWHPVLVKSLGAATPLPGPRWPRPAADRLTRLSGPIKS